VAGIVNYDRGVRVKMKEKFVKRFLESCDAMAKAYVHMNKTRSFEDKEKYAYENGRNSELERILREEFHVKQGELKKLQNDALEEAVKCQEEDKKELERSQEEEKDIPVFRRRAI
jgi:hypothetical protein